FTRAPRPGAVLVKGPVVLGFFSALVVMIAVPESRSARDIVFAFGAGMVVGLGFFAPVAGALAFRTVLRQWLTVRGSAVQWYASLLMVFALGYLLASVRHHSSDAFIGLALLVAFLCVLAKVVFAIVFGARNDPPSGGGGN